MAEQILSITSEEPNVTIKTHSSLSLQGWEQKQIKVQGVSRYSLNIRQDGDNVTITSAEDCLVILPLKAKVMIERVGSDAYVRNLQNDLVCQRIGGDLHLYKTGRVAVEQVSGDCEVLQVKGDVESRKVGGDFTGKDVSGQALIERVGGDFSIQGVAGPVTCRAGGDIHVGLSQKPTGNSNLVAGGDITLHMPEDSGATFEISSGGETIGIHLGEHIETTENRMYSTTVGDGSAKFVLRAGGDVYITDQGWKEGLLEGIQEEMDFQSASFQSSFEDRFEDVARQVASEAASRAEKRVQAALRRLEHRGFGGGHTSGYAYSATFKPDFPFRRPEPPQPPRPLEPVSEEERLMILKMVEAKKISIEEAEKLLEALEGK